MSEEVEFNEAELEALIQEALVQQAQSAPSASDRVVEAQTLFSYGDLKILQVIDDVFSKWIPREELAVAMGELRDHLYAGVNSSDIRTLHTFMVRMGKDIQLPHWNLQNPDVVIVSGYPPYGDEPSVLVDCLKEVGFSSRHCAWTWVNRAGGDAEVEPWLPFLFHEIRAWRPKLVITLGAEAAKPLVGELKLSEAHGVVHWMGPWAIMPCYSPAYAAKSSKINTLVSDLRSAHEFVFGRSP